MEKYLLATDFLDSNHPSISDLVSDITDVNDSDIEKAKKLFLYVRDSINYNMYLATNYGEDYRASNILKAGRGYCVQKAIILAALGRAAGIPSRLVLVAIRNHKAPKEALDIMKTNIFFPHMYNQFYINSKWVSATATFDKSICERINVGWVEFDGVNDGLLPSNDNDGNPYIEYIDRYGDFADFPFPFILSKLYHYYGEDYKIWFESAE
ncbi:MAG TPA: transglutaminase-like domain-containing protein [Syntrophomonadaceae bacterium]|nr:transglutaminase-like domain-containing protein [Syntrophomonadaceae bacterium]